MLGIKFIREHKDAVEEAILSKDIRLNLNELLVTDERRRELTRKAEDYKRERNVNNLTLKKQDCSQEDRNAVIERGRRLKQLISKVEAELSKVNKEMDVLMAMVPNITSPDTPVGKGDRDNVETFRSNVIPELGFTSKDHVQIGTDLGILDLERGTKVSGYRGYYIRNEGVSLMLGFMMYAINKMALKGYAPMLVPTIVKDFTLFGSGYFKGLEYNPMIDEIYEFSNPNENPDGKLSKERKFLVGTAEPSLLAYFAGDVLKEEQLPIRVSGFSQCYRSEIGSHGRDTRGIYRVHEFMKVEQVVLMRANVEESVKIQDEMVAISKEMHEELRIPYRQLQICTQDMGAGKYRMFDIEAWMPGLNRWGETGSASNFLDWQARRLNVRYKTLSGKKEHVFMLNNTALPSPRIFIAILENHQQEDGSVVVPEVIKPFMPVKCDVIRKK
ncbi:MAG: Serine--tRNA ligase [candidate division WS2 bacterium]|uniref:Serine--tRNA ligase n=1 Tax=Psychracetigena formicireducens TaxID=2986056 RepID=A0A9E2F828_PSYF1|nr:Serine--tRNA ligase [Candidatus Psychracetigena formicireducens]